MTRIWSDENKFETWKNVEIAVLEVLNEMGHVPKESLDIIKDKASVSCRKGHTSTSSNNETAAAEALRRSATSRCKAAAAAAISIIITAGSQSQRVISE